MISDRSFDGGVASLQTAQSRNKWFAFKVIYLLKKKITKVEFTPNQGFSKQ
jgi:hypothetical protein